MGIRELGSRIPCLEIQLKRYLFGETEELVVSKEVGVYWGEIGQDSGDSTRLQPSSRSHPSSPPFGSRYYHLHPGLYLLNTRQAYISPGL